MIGGLPCPCRGCAKRRPVCHDDCPAYASFKAELEAVRAAMRRDADNESYARHTPLRKSGRYRR